MHWAHAFPCALFTALYLDCLLTEVAILFSRSCNHLFVSANYMLYLKDSNCHTVLRVQVSIFVLKVAFVP